MQRPLSTVLIKIFARGFYKVHTGLLVFLFATLISYCFFINTAGDVKLLSPSEQLFYHFILVLTFVSSPIMTILFFLAWLFYTLKSWTYVSGQLFVANNQFLFYSCGSFSRFKQFKAWFITQFIISLPFVFYALIAAVTGVIFHHYVLPALILIFAFLLVVVSALRYVKQISHLISSKQRSALLGISKYWQKPFFSLFVYYILDQLKVSFILTKTISFLVIIGVLRAFADVSTDTRVAGLAVLGIVTAHALLIYQQHKFQTTYFTLARNLPYYRASLYLQQTLTYGLLLLPEVIWFFTGFKLMMGAGLLLLCLGLIMLMHSLLFHFGLAMNKYLPVVLSLFLCSSLFILFGLVPLLMLLCMLVSFTIFYFRYYSINLLPANE